MSRYTRRPSAWIADVLSQDDYPLIPDMAVSGHEAVFTGLLDASGEEIWREPNPMGFGRDCEW